jgi:hypothetical protein
MPRRALRAVRDGVVTEAGSVAITVSIGGVACRAMAAPLTKRWPAQGGAALHAARGPGTSPPTAPLHPPGAPATPNCQADGRGIQQPLPARAPAGGRPPRAPVFHEGLRRLDGNGIQLANDFIGLSSGSASSG